MTREKREEHGKDGIKSVCFVVSLWYILAYIHKRVLVDKGRKEISFLCFDRLLASEGREGNKVWCVHVCGKTNKNKE